ncbi:hypothetical protein GCM10009839_53920 [Catenulispora yoronensis]|uniref:Uncharacterized protein n=1 Tax=Catenulispora yoronensis TaxID=450799 RepID=A0ABP5GFS7_9ACTN
MSSLVRVVLVGATVVVAAWAGVEAQPVGRPVVGAVQRPVAERPVAERPVVRQPVVVDPGTLPQTRVLPRADQEFQGRLRALWQGIVDDRPEEARAFFFPKAAYVRLKDLGDAGRDYDYRLVGYFDLDVHAAHRLLGAGAGRAQLVGMAVPGGSAQWMPPGSEENKIPYYRVYGSRVEYMLDGKPHSFGVFSMLSWRGQWYAVHFGPWPRWERYGDVLQPR